MIRLETERLILRGFRLTDTPALYKYASRPDIGPACGWLPHVNRVETFFVILTMRKIPYTWALVEKKSRKLIGTIDLVIGQSAHEKLPDSQGEIGYWLAHEWRHQGYMKEAAERVLRFAFEDRTLQRVWALRFTDNEDSLKLMQSLGMRYDHTNYGRWWPALRVKKDEDACVLTKTMWRENHELLP